MDYLTLIFPEAAKIHFLRGSLTFPDPYQYPDEAATLSARLLKESLECSDGESILNTLAATASASAPSFFLIENLPVDEPLPYTPTSPDNYTTNGKGYISEWVHLGLLCIMGLRVNSHPEIQHGRPIHQIIPRVGDEHIPSNRGTIEFGYHTERSFHPPSTPDYLSLLALKNIGTKTNLLILEKIIETLSPHDIAALHDRQFRFCSGAAYDNKRHEEYIGPIITLNEKGQREFRFSILAVKMNGCTSKAQELVERLRNIANDPSYNIGICIPEGACLFFNNRQMAHGRGAITKQPAIIKDGDVMGDPDARWLQRITSVFAHGE